MDKSEFGLLNKFNPEWKPTFAKTTARQANKHESSDGWPACISALCRGGRAGIATLPHQLGMWFNADGELLTR
jgi:hypothetical protein